MEIGIVKERFMKKIRLTLYVFLPLILLGLSPILLPFQSPFGIILFCTLTIFVFIFIEKYVDSFIVVGHIVIEDNVFIFIQGGNKTTIPFGTIKSIVLNPVLGVSRIPTTFKTYKCTLTTIDNKVIQHQITREEIIDGKLLRKNILYPNRFDLIKFLESKKIRFDFGARNY